MHSSSIDNQSKVSGFRKFKRLLCKHYPRFSKISTTGKHLNQFLMLLYNCVPNLSQLLSIDKLLKNDNVWQLGICRNLSTALYSDTAKHEKLFDEKKAIQNVKITKQSHPYKIFASTYNNDILNSFNPEIQLKITEFAIKIKLKYLLSELREFKFVIFRDKKIGSDDTTKYSTFYSNSNAKTVINGSDIDNVFESICSTIILNIQRSLGKGLGWIIDLVVNLTVNVSKYNFLAGSSFIKLSKELDHPKKNC